MGDRKKTSGGSPKPTKDMGKRIRRFRKEAGYSQKDIAEIMEVSQNTVYNWETGRNRPDPDLFPELCSIMGISLNDLFGIRPEEQRITTHEKMLLDQYRQIDPEGRRIIDRVIYATLDEQLRTKEKQLSANVIMLDRISCKAAAGNGYAFSDIPVEDYCFVFRDDRNEKADGIIRVKGHSMEPVYHDGDAVYVAYTGSADEGEDVICASSAGIHIKRMGENEVYSLNKDYPFQPDGEVKIIGKVLGIVTSRDYPDRETLSLLEDIRHDEILDFKEHHHITL